MVFEYIYTDNARTAPRKNFYSRNCINFYDLFKRVYFTCSSSLYGLAARLMIKRSKTKSNSAALSNKSPSISIDPREKKILRNKFKSFFYSYPSFIQRKKKRKFTVEQKIMQLKQKQTHFW